MKCENPAHEIWHTYLNDFFLLGSWPYLRIEVNILGQGGVFVLDKLENLNKK